MNRTLSVAPLACLMLMVGGCATKGYVNDEIAALEAQLSGTMDESLTAYDARITANKRTAEDALRRAEEAGKLATGHLLGQTIMSNDDVLFSFDENMLSAEAEAVLANLAADLKRDNKDVYIEVQGHTDATGADSYNLMLGQKRADAVVDLLYRKHQIPLHRMSAFSYGESLPAADNGTKEGRAANRRVVIVVMN